MVIGRAMAYAPISEALRRQLAAEDPEWLDEEFGMDAARQKSASPRSYMTVDEGINHFRRWTQSDREIARKVAEYTGVTMAYVVPSESYVAFVRGGSDSIRFTASLGVLRGGRFNEYGFSDSFEFREILAGGVTRLELSRHGTSASGYPVPREPTKRYCQRCFLELPLSLTAGVHEEC